MPTLNAADMADMTKGTMRELGRLKFQQIAQDLQDYEIMSHWLRKGRVKMESSGYGIQRNLMYRTEGHASHVGLFEEDDVNVENLFVQLRVDWVHAKTDWAWERREGLMNRGKALVFNIIKPRRVSAFIDLAKELEAKAWVIPAVADTHLPKGIPYWIVYNGTTGFTGGLPGSHTTIGNVDLTTVGEKFQNYSFNYTSGSITKADLIKPLRTMMRRIGWKSPVTIQDYRSQKGKQCRLYCQEATISGIEDLAELQNENLGTDMAPYGASRDIEKVDGTVTFKRFPWIWVPYLDDAGFTGDTNSPTDPIFAVDHSTFHMHVLKGDFLHETVIDPASKQHNVVNSFIDLTYNYLCVDRRRNGIAASA